MNIKRAKILKPSQIRHLLRVTEATSRHPERDALIHVAPYLEVPKKEYREAIAELGTGWV